MGEIGGFCSNFSTNIYQVISHSLEGTKRRAPYRYNQLSFADLIALSQ